MRSILIISILFLALCACHRSSTQEKGELDKNKTIEKTSILSCRDIPRSFTSYEEAVKIITMATFVYRDEIETKSSSWITSASYLSCDNQTGFFIIYTKGRNYIHKNLPKTLWIGFKCADSFGSYYNQYIKNRFTLLLSN